MVQTESAETERKAAEAEFHDRLRGELRDDPRHQSNQKWYSVAAASSHFVIDYLRHRCVGKRVLDYCCGDGEFALLLARAGADVYGIDISPVSIENARAAAEREGLGGAAKFEVMDAEATSFSPGYFDYVHVDGVLHHLELDKAFAELARILKPSGQVICREALKHNLLFRLYRKLTPHLRTAWEVDHILGKEEIGRAKEHFQEVRVLRFFHLLSLAAVPLRSTPLFGPLLRVLEGADGVCLRMPLVKWQAWIAVFLLAKPKRLSAERTSL